MHVYRPSPNEPIGRDPAVHALQEVLTALLQPALDGLYQRIQCDADARARTQATFDAPRAEAAALGVIQGIAEDLKALVANPNTIVAGVDKIARALHDHAAIIAAAIVANTPNQVPATDPDPA